MRHEEVHELLPWFVNGTLSDAERARVSAHIDSCLVCRRVVQRERRLLLHMAAEPAANTAIDAGFRRLMDHVDTRRRRPSPPAAASEHRFSWAYAVMMLVGIGIAIWMATPRESVEPAPFATVTDRQGAAATRLDIVLDASIDARAHDTIAQSIATGIGARIVASPTENGRYMLELPDRADEQTINETLERLRSDPRVQFAGRAHIATSDRVGGDP